MIEAKLRANRSLIEHEALVGQRIASRSSFGNRNRRSLLAAAYAVVARQAGTREEGFDTA